MISTEIITHVIVEWIIVSNYSVIDSSISTNTNIHKHITSLKQYVKKQLAMLIDSARVNYIVAPIIMLDGMNHFVWHSPGLSHTK